MNKMTSKDDIRIETVDALVIGADLNCYKCNEKKHATFNPYMSYNPEFIDMKPKLICSKCNYPYSSVPIFENRAANCCDEKKIKQQQKVTKEDIEFIFKTMTTEAKYDVISVKQLAIGMFSAFTKIPMPHNCSSKNSGAGKSYLTNGVADYFPNQYVIVLVGASDKAFHHKQGILVIKDKDSGELKQVQPMIETMEQQIENLEDEKQDKPTHKMNKAYATEIKELEREIKDLKNRAQKLIDLDNTIIILQDTPQDSLFDTLMSLLSQDTQKNQITFSQRSQVLAD